MRYIKKFESFISGPEIEIKPETPVVKPEIDKRPAPPSIIPDEQQSDMPAPAKAQLEMATAEDVVVRFIELINQSGDDIKKYVEM